MALDGTITRRSLNNTSTPQKLQLHEDLVTGANVLIAALFDNQIQITGIILSASADGIYVLNSGSDPIMTLNLLAKVPFMMNAEGMDCVLFAGNVGGDFNITSPGTAGNVYLQYRMKPS